jgi:glycogen operon protein
VRDYWRGETSAATLAPRLCASGDIFNHEGRRPSACVNFVTAHDGFTLQDLVSYNEKHNEANGEENRDGHSHNRSWNCGAEGPTDDAEILRLRERQKRNFLATLLFAQGTPMMLAGDELGRSQKGNNNAYCQDNEISWHDWNLDDRAKALLGYVQKLTALRHEYPQLRRSRFLTGDYNEAIDAKDLTWLNANGSELTEEDWQDGNMRGFCMLIDGRVSTSALASRGQDATLLLVFNSYHDLVEFTLPTPVEHATWKRLVDTNLDSDGDRASFDGASAYGVTGRSFVLFALN